MQVSWHLWQLHDENVLEDVAVIQTNRGQPHEQVLQSPASNNGCGSSKSGCHHRRSQETNEKDAARAKEGQKCCGDKGT